MIHGFSKIRSIAALGFLLLGGSWLLAGNASAQIQVGMQIPRQLYIRYEPILVSVTITNFSGRPLLLQDQDNHPWFSFQIEDHAGRPVQTRVQGVGREPAAIGPGETLQRRVNLTPIYALDDYGRYSVRASVYDGQSGQFFRSAPANIEITDGRVLWQQTVGNPIDGTPRQITLLAHRLTNSTAVYVRIQDPDAGRVFCTHRLGPLVTHGRPEVEIDGNNEVHILHMQAPRSFVHSHIGLNGRVLERKAYDQAQTKPTLVREPDGRVLVVGGAVFEPPPEGEAGHPASFSDRPVQLPGPDMRPVQPPGGTDTPPPEEDRRPGGLNIWPFNR